MPGEESEFRKGRLTVEGEYATIMFRRILHHSPELAESLSRNGRTRARDFSWGEHVERLLGLAAELAGAGSR